MLIPSPSASKVTSALVAIVTGMSPTSGSALGGYTVTFYGANLLLIKSINFPKILIYNDGCNPHNYGSEFCSSLTVSVKDDAMTFVMPPGGGNGQSYMNLVFINSSVAPNALASSLTYIQFPFKFTSDLLSFTHVVPATIPQTGGTITISGTNFGALPGKLAFYYNIFFTAAVPLTVISWSSTQIVCSAPAGTGISGLRVFSAQGSYSPFLPLSYTPKNTDPFIKNVTTDGVSFTITGSNFGAAQGNGGVYVMNFGTGNENVFCVIFWSTNAIVFQNCLGALDSGSNLVVVTNTGLQSAQYVPYACVPFVAGLSVTSGPVTGGGSLTINGSNFDPKYSLAFLIGNGSSIQLSCNPALSSYISMFCQLPPASAGTYVVVVQTSTSKVAPTFSSSSIATASNIFTYVSCAPKTASNPACSCLLTLPICYSIATLPLVQTPVTSGSLTLTYSVSQTASGYAFAQNSYVKANTTILSYTNGKVKVNPSSITSILAKAWDGGLPADLGCICA